MHSLERGLRDSNEEVLVCSSSECVSSVFSQPVSLTLHSELLQIDHQTEEFINKLTFSTQLLPHCWWMGSCSRCQQADQEDGMHCASSHILQGHPSVSYPGAVPRILW